MSYVGSSAAVIPVGFSGVNSQSFNGDGSTVAFTLNRPVSAVNAIEVMVNNVQQSPYDGSYSVSSTTLTFSAAPSSGTANIYVVYRDFPVGSITDPNTYTKAQTDTLLDARVAKSGDTMTGNLIVDANVGIGTSSPATKLHVEVSGASSIITNKGTSSNYYGYAGSTLVTQLLSATTQTFLNSVANVPIIFGTNDTERMRIDSAGRVTMPYQPAFSGRIVTHQSGVLVMTNMTLNNGSHYSTSNGKFTAPVAGMYYFILTTLEQGTGGPVSIRKNGSTVGSQGWMATTNSTAAANVIVSLAVGDYVEAYGGVTCEADYTGFSGFLIG